MKLSSSAAIYIEFDRHKMRIPVNPEEIEISYPTDNQEFDVIGVGKVVVPRKPSLKEISWESWFPSSFSDPYIEGTDTPEEWHYFLTTAMKNQVVIRCIISRSGLYDTNISCVVEDFTTTDKGGEPGDMYYSLTLKEWKDYSPKTVQIIQQPVQVTTTQTQAPAQATAQPERPVETPTLRVGAQVIVNGKYWYTSYGDKPFGTANNLKTTIFRIVESNPFPISVGYYGWVKRDQIQIVG